MSDNPDHILNRPDISAHFEGAREEREIPILSFLNDFLSFLVRGPESVPQWTLPGSYNEHIFPTIRHTTVMSPTNRAIADASTDFMGANARAIEALIREDVREAINEAFGNDPDIQRFMSVTGLNPSLIGLMTQPMEDGTEALTATGQRVQELFSAAQETGQNPFLLVNYLYTEGQLNDAAAAESILSMANENWNGITVLALTEYEARDVGPTDEIDVSLPVWQHWMAAPTEVNPNGPLAFLNDARATVMAAPAP